MDTLSSYRKQSSILWFLRGIITFSFLVLFARLFDLQIIKGSYYKSLSEENRIRYIPITAPRGRILARGGESLVDNSEVKLGLIFDSQGGYKKVRDAGGIASGELITEPQREYSLSDKAAHITGYLGEITPSELDKVDPRCPEKGVFNIDSLVGRGGIEEKYNCSLSGTNGEELVEVDANGRKVRVLGRREPISGADIKTTIDYSLQSKVSEILKDKKGVVIVTNTKGEVYSLYSSPSYDPNILVSGEAKGIEKILNDKNLPMFNRAISGTFHPGSIFKPFVAISALEEQVIDKKFVYDDTGRILIDTLYGNFAYNNWYFTQYGGVEGKIDLKRAIARSTDTFFYKIGEMTGIEKLVTWGSKFGLDKATGIDLPSETIGLVPSPKWKMDVKGERWFLGNTYHTSIGQGDIALTPVALNSAIATIAAGGEYCVLHLVSGEESENAKSKKQKAKCKDLGIKKENIELVKEGMVGACSVGGTGYTFFDFKEKHGVDVACKTGTAETDDVDNSTHAWFVAFAPNDDPEIVATVLIEKGGEGSKVAGPIAREIFDYWFGRKN